MALIFCPNCGAKVSDRAQACPKCGSALHALSESAESPAQQPEAVQTPTVPVVRPVSASAVKMPKVVKAVKPTIPEPQPTEQPRPRAILNEAGNPASQAPSPQISLEHKSSGKLPAYAIVGILIVGIIVFLVAKSLLSPGGSSSSSDYSYPETSTQTNSSESTQADPTLISHGDRVYTFADNTWLRSSMDKGVDYNKLLLLKADASMTVLGTYGEWVNVRSSSGTEGYVATNFLMSTTEHTALTQGTSLSQRNALKMAKYRRAVATHLIGNPGASYKGLISERKFSDTDETAILLLFDNANGSAQNVLFVFPDYSEYPGIHTSQAKIYNPRIVRNGSGYSIGGA